MTGHGVGWIGNDARIPQRTDEELLQDVLMARFERREQRFEIMLAVGKWVLLACGAVFALLVLGKGVAP